MKIEEFFNVSGTILNSPDLLDTGHERTVPDVVLAEESGHYGLTDCKNTETVIGLSFQVIMVEFPLPIVCKLMNCF